MSKTQKKEGNRDDKFSWTGDDIKFIVEPGAAKPAKPAPKTTKGSVTKKTAKK